MTILCKYFWGAESKHEARLRSYSLVVEAQMSTMSEALGLILSTKKTKKQKPKAKQQNCSKFNHL